MIDATQLIYAALSTIPGLAVHMFNNPQITVFPAVAITTIDNSESIAHTTIEQEEKVSRVTVQLDLYAKQGTLNGRVVTADRLARHYASLIVDKMAAEVNMRRMVFTGPVAYDKTGTLMRYIMRYTGSFWLATGELTKGV